MNKLTIDVGIKEFEVNGKGILRFNPSDPELYERFVCLTEELTTLEKEFTTKAEKAGISENKGENIIHLMHEYDTTIKSKLSIVFGEENDFNKILEGVSLLAVTLTGRVVTNLINALAPILEEGASRHIEDSAAEAVNAAKFNREQRRALEKR